MPHLSPQQKYQARKLRNNMTQTEQKLWKFLRNKHFKSKAFRRQFNIGPYIADFICLEARLVIECDGGQHLLQQKYDQERDAYFMSQGFQVLRFWDHEILQDINAVLEKIWMHLTPPP